MSPPARRRARPAADPFPEPGLAELGLAPGDAVRFRRNDGERWKPANVTGRERDGSVGLVDRRGAARAIDVACIEVRIRGPRGGTAWEPLAERAARTEQLALVRDAPPPDRRDRRASAGAAAPVAGPLPPPAEDDAAATGARTGGGAGTGSDARHRGTGGRRSPGRRGAPGTDDGGPAAEQLPLL